MGKKGKIMQKTLDQNNEYTLHLEWMGKRHGGYWLELINRTSGHVKIMTAPRKELFDGVKISHAIRWLSNEQWKPMYKAGVM